MTRDMFNEIQEKYKECQSRVAFNDKFAKDILYESIEPQYDDLQEFYESEFDCSVQSMIDYDKASSYQQGVCRGIAYVLSVIENKHAGDTNVKLANGSYKNVDPKDCYIFAIKLVQKCVRDLNGYKEENQ